MSARQRQRLQQLKLAEAQHQLQQQQGGDDESEESEEEEAIPHRIFSFAGMAESSSEDDDEEEGEDNESKANEGVGNRRSVLVSKERLAEQEEQELAREEAEEAALLDSLIHEASTQQQSPQNLRKNYLAELFALQTSLGKSTGSGSGGSGGGVAKSLDIDALMSKRFGAAAAFAAQVERDGGGGGGGSRKAGIGGPRSSGRKWLFGRKDEWGSPEPYARGGLGMIKQQQQQQQRQEQSHTTARNTSGSASASSSSGISSANCGKYTMDRSPGSDRSEGIYQAVAITGDVNRLVLYLVHVDAFHCGALLQLATLFCKLPGSMERAMDLVRRALHTFEVAALESFWKDVAAGDAGGGHDEGFSLVQRCLLDWRIPENTSLFIALFRYMQISAMMGYNALAADTARMTLCLSPTDDPMNVLLALDCHLVRSCRASATAAMEARALIRAYMGMQSSTIEKNLTTGREWIHNTFAGLEQSLELAAPALAEEAAGSSNGNDASTGSHTLWQRVTVAQLPSWWFSLALVEAECETRERADGATGVAAPLQGSSFPGQGRATGISTSATESAQQSSAQPLSVLLMAEAVRRWPQALLALLDRVESGAVVLEIQARLKVCKQEVQRWLTTSPASVSGRGNAGRSKLGEMEDLSPWADIDCTGYADPIAFDGTAGQAMDHLCAIFVERHADLYADSARLALLQQAVKLATHIDSNAGPIPLQKHANYSNYSPAYLSRHPALDKYKSALVEDFGEKFTFIPEDANPLEPGLMDPMMLEVQQRELQRQHARREEGVDLATLLGVQVQDDGDAGRRRQQLEQAYAGIDFSMFLGPQAMVMNDGAERADGGEREGGAGAGMDLEALLMSWINFSNDNGNSANGAHANANHVQRGDILNAVRSAETAQYALDPDAPLMQLFLQSMFPWFRAP